MWEVWNSTCLMSSGPIVQLKRITTFKCWNKIVDSTGDAKCTTCPIETVDLFCLALNRPMRCKSIERESSKAWPPKKKGEKEKRSSKEENLEYYEICKRVNFILIKHTWQKINWWKVKWLIHNFLEVTKDYMIQTINNV